MRASGAVMRVRRSALVALALICAGGMLAGCAPEQAPETPQATAAPGATPEPEATPGPAPAEQPWERFADDRMPYSFEIPPGWTVTDLGGDPDTGVFQLGVVNAGGEQLLTFASRVQGLGGACGDLPVLAIEEADSLPVAPSGYVAASASPAPLVDPRVVYRVSAVEGGAIAALSLSNDKPIDACMYYNLMHTEQGLMMFASQLQVDSYDPAAQHGFFPSVEEARAYAETPEYAQLVRVLSSFRFA